MSTDERATSPLLVDEPVGGANDEPAIDHDNDDAMDLGENLGDLGGDADDGNDTDPHKFIHRSLHYQDMLMTKKHAEERVEYFTKFAKKMPNGKDPHKKIASYKKRVDKVSLRITKFKEKYAGRRLAAKEARDARIAKEKETKKEEKFLGKNLKSVISKEMKKASALAAKAATDAIKALGKDATSKATALAGFTAYSQALQRIVGESEFFNASALVKDKKESEQVPADPDQVDLIVA